MTALPPCWHAGCVLVILYRLWDVHLSHLLLGTALVLFVAGGVLLWLSHALWRPDEMYQRRGRG